MEFLMTYSWAIMVVLAAIGALAHFGLIQPSKPPTTPDVVTVHENETFPLTNYSCQTIYVGLRVDVPLIEHRLNVTFTNGMGNETRVEEQTYSLQDMRDELRTRCLERG